MFLGTGAFGTAGQIRFAPYPDIKAGYIESCGQRFFQKFQYMFYIFWVLLKTLLDRPVFIYASDPLSCPAAVIAGFILRIKLVYHEHDMPKQEKQKFFLRAAMAARQITARKADICIMPNRQRLDIFLEKTGRIKKSYCVRNYPQRHEAKKAREKKQDDFFTILYHGSINSKRLPESVVYALSMLPANVNLKIFGYETAGGAGYIEHIKALARGLKIEKRIGFGLFNREQLLFNCRNADIGLALLPPIDDINLNIRYMAGASNKVFDYLACGLPVLVPDLDDWNNAYVKPGYGLSCNPDNPDNIAKTVKWFIDNPQRMQDMGEKGRQKILSDWNYEKEFSPVLEEINRYREKH